MVEYRPNRKWKEWIDDKTAECVERVACNDLTELYEMSVRVKVGEILKCQLFENVEVDVKYTESIANKTRLQSVVHHHVESIAHRSVDVEDIPCLTWRQ